MRVVNGSLLIDLLRASSTDGTFKLCFSHLVLQGTLMYTETVGVELAVVKMVFQIV